MIMLVVDTLLYGLLAVWLDNIVPTEYGTRRLPWFCLQPFYWRRTVGVLKQPLTPLPSSPHMESVPASLVSSTGVQIRNLRKVFSKSRCYGRSNSGVVAVEDVSLDVYPGEITAILGHNGAGKTTLFNMLTGMTSVTSGEAQIFGYNVRSTNLIQIQHPFKISNDCFLMEFDLPLIRE